MAIRTKRWNDPIEPEDGTRILICRYRPRGLPKSEETWTEWAKEVAPGTDLLAAAYGRRGMQATWEVYRRAYLQEMKSPAARGKIQELAGRLRGGETITLLCSSQCEREARCHRSLLRDLIEAEIRKAEGS